MTRLAYFFRSAVNGLWRTPYLYVVAVTTIAIALFVSSLARSVWSATNAVLDTWGSEVELTVYLDEAVSEPIATALADRIRLDSEGTVAFVPKSEALVRLKADLGELAAVLDGLPSNPLPSSLEVRPGPRLRSAAHIRALAERWSALAGVAEVDWGREWVQRIESLSRGLRTLGVAGMLVVFGAAVIVVAATLQLAVYARRDEIEIEKLVGATDAFVKAPFLIEGLVQGALGAGVAAAALWAVDIGAGARVGQLLRFAGAAVPRVVFAAPERLAELAVAGLLLGLLGSLLAVRRFLKV